LEPDGKSFFGIPEAVQKPKNDFPWGINKPTLRPEFGIAITLPATAEALKRAIHASSSEQFKRACSLDRGRIIAVV
jgi:hypothetical protein